jgi:hypothetical protein
MNQAIGAAADPEAERLLEDLVRTANWKRWGPYLSDRQWGTVREDYSATGECWTYLSHDDSRSRAYRWGEDGLLGICDRECRLCFALTVWNERDTILKERLFGLTGPEGNHGEDVKECYFHLDATPTSSYLRALYKYPQAAFPYAELVAENARRDRSQPEFEITDISVFDDGRYFDVDVEYAKAAPDDIAIRITASNRGPDPAPLHVLPTLWFRNTWSWGRSGEGYWPKPRISITGERALLADHASLGRFVLESVPAASDAPPQLLFTENETDMQRLYGAANASPYVKDAFHRRLVGGDSDAVNPAKNGTKAAFHHALTLQPGQTVVLRLRLHPGDSASRPMTAVDVDSLMTTRIAEADRFYAARIPSSLAVEDRRTVRHAYAGLLWSKQFYHYAVKEWLEGDPAQPVPPPSRLEGRNHEWTSLYNRDVISMPDCWEYPWYAAWDLAFHCVAFARIDPHFAKEQLILLLREWYMHANGQLPAYEFAFSDVNPPVHAWACWRVYKATGPRGQRDMVWLKRVFHKLLINFTWWVNRKDPRGDNIFAGGFLGLDNIGVFDRSQELPTGGSLAQADGTAWMAFFCTTMLAIALELAGEDPAYEDVASKFFEHFVAITDAMNSHGGTGLWNEEDGFYYDQLLTDGETIPLTLRSMVGVIPLFAVEVIDDHLIERLPGFAKRMRWFVENRSDLARHVAYMSHGIGPGHGSRLLAIPSRERLVRVLQRLLDEDEFLSPFGIRSLSKVYGANPFVLPLAGEEHMVRYVPAESDTYLFGGNSNWRGPIWFPVNYLLVEALERYHHFYGDDLTVECPRDSGQMLTLAQVAREISTRLARLFMAGSGGGQPWQGADRRWVDDPHWRGLPQFHEYFDGDTGRGCGASHQTGWTALVARCFDDVAAHRH